MAPCAGLDDKPVVMGDSAYAGAELRERLDAKGFDVTAKVPPASNRDGRYSKDDFDIDLEADVVWCPAEIDGAANTGPMVPGSHRSVMRAGAARSESDARPRRAGARSASPATRPACNKPKPIRPTRTGRPATGPHVRKSNAKSDTSPAEPTAAAGDGEGSKDKELG